MVNVPLAAVFPLTPPIVTLSPLTRPVVEPLITIGPALLAPVMVPVGSVVHSTWPVTSLTPSRKKFCAFWSCALQVTLIGTITVLLEVKMGSP